MNDNVVISYIISRWIGLIILFALLGILFIIFSFIPDTKKYRCFLIIPIILFAIYAMIPTIFGIIDISQQSYISESISYYRDNEENTRNQLIASENIQITFSDGKTLILKGATSNFPYGKFTGRITYAKRSKIVIDFVPDKALN